MANIIHRPVCKIEVYNTIVLSRFKGGYTSQVRLRFERGMGNLHMYLHRACIII